MKIRICDEKKRKKKEIPGQCEMTGFLRAVEIEIGRADLSDFGANIGVLV